MVRIFSIVIPARVFTLFVSEIILLFGSFMAATALDPDVEDVRSFLQYDSGWLRIGIVAGFVIFGIFFRNLYRDVHIRDRLELFQNLSMIFGFAFIGQGLISYVDSELIVPRKVMLSGSLLALAGLFTGRLLFNKAATLVTRTRRVLFLGMSPTVIQLAARFRAHPEFGFTSVGYLETGDPETAIPDTPGQYDSGSVARLGNMAGFDAVLDEYMPESIVIGKREDIQPWWVGEFLALRFGGVQIEEASRLYERLFTRKCATEIWPSRLIFAGALEPRPASVTLQWFYSQAIAFVLLVAASPLILAIALAIKAGSPGRILERQPRVGLCDRVFDAFSFRCTRSDGSETGVGKFLRKRHLVSLPRLFNVLRGDMSVVGPRPESAAYVERLSQAIPFYRQRHRVKPGLTGWAEVQGGRVGHDSLRELEYDLYYLENLSPMLDSFILLMTLRSPWQRA